MNWLKKLFRKAQNLVCRKRRIRSKHLSVLPDRLDAYTLYVIGQNGHRWHVAMVCPCGCGSTLFMNLLDDEDPCWSLTEHKDGSASLHPSVWRKVGCESHFFLRRGEVQWCKG